MSKLNELSNLNLLLQEEESKLSILINDFISPFICDNFNVKKLKLTRSFKNSLTIQLVDSSDLLYYWREEFYVQLKITILDNNKLEFSYQQNKLACDVNLYEFFNDINSFNLFFSNLNNNLDINSFNLFLDKLRTLRENIKSIQNQIYLLEQDIQEESYVKSEQIIKDILIPIEYNKAEEIFDGFFKSKKVIDFQFVSYDREKCSSDIVLTFNTVEIKRNKINSIYINSKKVTKKQLLTMLTKSFYIKNSFINNTKQLPFDWNDKKLNFHTNIENLIELLKPILSIKNF